MHPHTRVPTVLKKPAAKPDATRLRRHNWNKDGTGQEADMPGISLPVQELQVGDLSTLSVRAPLSLLLNRKQEERRESG